MKISYHAKLDCVKPHLLLAHQYRCRVAHVLAQFHETLLRSCSRVISVESFIGCSPEIFCRIPWLPVSESVSRKQCSPSFMIKILHRPPLSSSMICVPNISGTSMSEFLLGCALLHQRNRLQLHFRISSSLARSKKLSSLSLKLVSLC